MLRTNVPLPTSATRGPRWPVGRSQLTSSACTTGIEGAFARDTRRRWSHDPHPGRTSRDLLHWAGDPIAHRSSSAPHAAIALHATPSRAYVSLSPTARTVIAAAARRHGRQAIVLSWPAGAAYLPAACYTPGPHDVVLGHTEDCAIYADSRNLAVHPSHRVILDATAPTPHRLTPPLRVRRLAQP